MRKESDTALISTTCPIEPSKVQNATPASPSSPLTAVSISNASTGGARTTTSYGPVPLSYADTRTRYRPAVGKTASSRESSVANSLPSGDKSRTIVRKESDTALISTTCPAEPSKVQNAAPALPNALTTIGASIISDARTAVPRSRAAASSRSRAAASSRSRAETSSRVRDAGPRAGDGRDVGGGASDDDESTIPPVAKFIGSRKSPARSATRFATRRTEPKITIAATPMLSGCA